MKKIIKKLLRPFWEAYWNRLSLYTSDYLSKSTDYISKSTDYISKSIDSFSKSIDSFSKSIDRLPQYVYNCRPINLNRQRNDEEMVLKAHLDNYLYLEYFGFKVFSQNDEDGIIEEIFNRIKTTNKTFVEFGVENGLESNCHYLLHKGWNGLWIEGSEDCTNAIKQLFNKPIEDKRLTIVNDYITKDNINTLINSGGISGEIDLLSIDIDGNDYYVWEEIKCISPRVVVIEYNAKFPPTFEWIMEYDPNHLWPGTDKHGASLKSLELLGQKLGYQMVGTNLRGVNAFFVKKELAKDLFAMPATSENLYNPIRLNVQYIASHPSKEYIGK